MLQKDQDAKYRWIGGQQDRAVSLQKIPKQMLSANKLQVPAHLTFIEFLYFYTLVNIYQFPQPLNGNNCFEKWIQVI